MGHHDPSEFQLPPSLICLPSHTHRRIKPDTHDRPGRQLDVLAVGSRDRTARTNDGAENRALHTADQATDDATNTGAHTGRPGFASDAFAFEHLRRSRSHINVAATHAEAI